MSTETSITWHMAVATRHEKGQNQKAKMSFFYENRTVRASSIRQRKSLRGKQDRLLMYNAELLSEILKQQIEQRLKHSIKKDFMLPEI